MKVKTVNNGWYLWLENADPSMSGGKMVPQALVYDPDPNPVGSGHHLQVNMEYYHIEENDWPVIDVIEALSNTYKGAELHKKLVEFGVIDKDLK